ncbi:hypothetical protein TMEN_2943 [Trichophyton mentagrophytes]|nr:hypothetical protein TMEN_2943 [Trichophyton mentagrophytes]
MLISIATGITGIITFNDEDDHIRRWPFFSCDSLQNIIHRDTSVLYTKIPKL